MGPGPSDVNPRILQALSRPTIGQLDPKFVEMMDEVKSLPQFAFQTSNALTIPISALSACYLAGGGTRTSVAETCTQSIAQISPVLVQAVTLFL